MAMSPRSQGIGSLIGMAVVAAWSAIGYPAGPPVQAEHMPSHQPSKRLELRISTIEIHDDSDPGGTGEWRIGVAFAAEPGGTVLNQTLRNNRVRTGTDWNVNTTLSPLPVFEDQRVRVQFVGVDEDGGWFDTDDPLGGVVARFDEAAESGLGTHHLRSSTEKYSVTFTIHLASLPDLSVSVEPLPGHPFGPGEPAFLCLMVRNHGARTSESFRVRLLTASDDRDEYPDSTVMLTAEQSLSIRCTEGWSVILAGARRYRVHAIVDPLFEIAESDERNNEFRRSWQFE
jgi:hypothetical protein